MAFSPEDLGELGELEPGDVIFYDWDTDDTPADGVSDHVGLVVGVNKNEIYVIEGNMNDSLGIRTIRSYTTYSSAMAFVDIDYGANDN